MGSTVYVIFGKKARFANFVKELGYNVLLMEKLSITGETVSIVKREIEKDPVLFLFCLFGKEELGSLRSMLQSVKLAEIENIGNSKSQIRKFVERLEQSEKYSKTTVVSGLIISKDGKLLLVKKKGKWILHGGTVEEGENLRAALVREVYEETGVKIDPSVPEYVHRKYVPNLDLRWLVYKCSLPFSANETDISVLDELEGIEDVRWFEKEHAFSIAPPITREVLQKILS